MKTSRKIHTHRPQTTHLSTRQNTEKRKQNWCTHSLCWQKCQSTEKTQEKYMFQKRSFSNQKSKKQRKTTSTRPRESRKSGDRTLEQANGPSIFVNRSKVFVLYKKPREPIKLRVGLNDMMWLVVRLCRHVWSVPSRKRIANGGRRDDWVAFMQSIRIAEDIKPSCRRRLTLYIARVKLIVVMLILWFISWTKGIVSIIRIRRMTNLFWLHITDLEESILNMLLLEQFHITVTRE